MRYIAVVLLFGIVCQVSYCQDFQEIGGKHYYIENYDKLNWFDARDKCRSMDAHLVSIQNYGEWYAITAHLSSCKSYWVDIRDADSKMDFKSETTGQSPFLKWSHGQPRCKSDYDCVKLRKTSHKMKTKYCSQENHYICEAYPRPPPSPPVTSAPISTDQKEYPIIDLDLYNH